MDVTSADSSFVMLLHESAEVNIGSLIPLQHGKSSLINLKKDVFDGASSMKRSREQDTIIEAMEANPD